MVRFFSIFSHLEHSIYKQFSLNCEIPHLWVSFSAIELVFKHICYTRVLRKLALILLLMANLIEKIGLLFISTSGHTVFPSTKMLVVLQKGQ